jgi:hypothetical protein
MSRLLRTVASFSLVAACSTGPTAIAPEVDRDPAAKNLPSPWKDSWSEVVVNAISDESPLIKKAPKGVESLCPKFRSFSTADRKNFWASFFEALAYAESNHITSTKFGESFGVTSRGLLQISVLSAKGHGGKCAGATADQLHTAGFNLRCGVTILERQFNKNDAINNKGVPPVGPYELRIFKSDGLHTHYYWSTLNPKVSKCGYWRFRNWLANLESCVTPIENPANCK